MNYTWRDPPHIFASWPFSSADLARSRKWPTDRPLHGNGLINDWVDAWPSCTVARKSSCSFSLTCADQETQSVIAEVQAVHLGAHGIRRVLLRKDHGWESWLMLELTLKFLATQKRFKTFSSNFILNWCTSNLETITLLNTNWLQFKA